jgi:hypothetical protein
MKTIAKLLVVVFSIAMLSSIFTTASANGGPHNYISSLWAGREHNVVGLVLVDWVDDDTLRVIYETDGNWKLIETHLIVAESLNDIPQTKSGNPKIGQFPYASEHYPGVTHYTYYVDIDCEGPFVIAAHAVVQCGCQCETAWAQGPCYEEFPGNNWAVYFNFNIPP